MMEAAEALTNDGFQICLDFLHSTLFERYVQNVIYASILCCFCAGKIPERYAGTCARGLRGARVGRSMRN